MKPITRFILIGLLSTSPLISMAEDNPLNQMMNTAKDIMKSGSDTANEIIKSGSDVAQEATEKAKDIVDSSSKTATETVEKIKEVTDSTTETVVDKVEEVSKDFKWSKAVMNALEKGDPKKGEELAKKAKCSKCHGDTGVSDEDDTPSIAGQIAAYNYKQLHDYKMKLRDDRDMFKKTKKLSDQDMIDIAAWYATQKPEDMAGKGSKKIPVLANKGDKKRFLLACDTCHNDKAMKRGFQTPIIEGQKPEHFVETMLAFKEGERTNDHYKLMQSIASRLTEAEINELAAYYAAKPMQD